MKKKYSMTQEENIFFAKRNLVDYIYNSAKLEGCNVTFPETQTILDGVNVGSVQLYDIQTILNLRDAWRFILDNLNNELNVEYICDVNEKASRNQSLKWGELRTGTVGIAGTDYVPPIPDEDAINKEFENLNGVFDIRKRAIDYFLFGCKSQLFWDGNKRTSMIIANKILIEHGAGILTVKDSQVLEFNEKLSEFYSTQDDSTIAPWLYGNCIVEMVI